MSMNETGLLNAAMRDSSKVNVYVTGNAWPICRGEKTVTLLVSSLKVAAS